MDNKFPDIADILENVFRITGYDFRQYAKASIRRRLYLYLNRYEYNTIEAFYRALESKTEAHRFINQISVPVSDMFRDPQVFKKLKDEVFPYLATYPVIKVWHAGCATGEEVYSLAILLYEANLLERSIIFATDISSHIIHNASKGIFPIEQFKDFTRQYQKAGGNNSFSDYYHTQNEHGIIIKKIRNSLTFAQHNLVTDGMFGEMNLIMCRNVLIYFNRKLQNTVISLLTDSLSYNGFLCIGTKETIAYTDNKDQYSPVSGKMKIYKKIK